MQTKREIAADILSREFQHQTRVRIVDLAQVAAEHGVSRRTLTRAARDMGLREVHNGPFPALWERAKP